MRKIFLLDGYNLMYRMFYAVPPFTNPEGLPVNAVFGLAKLLLGFHASERPDQLVIVMDSKAENFRAKIYPEYKAQRDRMPDDLRSQESLIFELFSVFKIPVVAKAGFEADDIIGTFATELARDPENDIYIVSGDKDLYQFVGDRVAVYDTMKRITARRKEAIEKFSVPPERVVDYLAIVGDSSDNIPGIPGFGPKKAESLIGQYGALEDIYDHIDDITGKTRETLESSREIAFLSKQLATIDVNVDVIFDAASSVFAPRTLLNEEVISFFKRLDFRSLLPASEVKISRFEDMDISARAIESMSELQFLEDRLKSVRSITLATYGKKDALSGLVIQLEGEGEFFHLRPSVTSLVEFLDILFSLPDTVQIIGYDLKADLRRIDAYRKNTSRTVTQESLSLF